MTKQKTIRSSVSIEGIGLQTGSKTKLEFKSAPADSGINFIRVDLPDKPLINIQSLDPESSAGGKRRTGLGSGRARVETTEHLLAALSGLGINNITIEIDGVELPGLDGSAKVYAETFERAGIVEQDAPLNTLTLKEPVWCSAHGASLEASPHDGFRISYSLSYPVPSIGRQFLSLEITEEKFRREIAPARTFCMKKEALLLLLLGFGRGANFKNTLVMGKKGPMRNSLRFPDECVRHKILDLIGDLCLVGMPIKAHIVAVKSGHRLNMELVKKLKSQMSPARHS